MSEKNMVRPKVSIVIPVYNGANYLAQAIESALAQTYDNIEIIVVNDGSTDDGETDRVIDHYIDRVRYLKKENGGSSSALNTGIRNMTGEWFSWLSHDDLYYPQKIQRQVEWMNRLEVPEYELSDYVFFAAADLIDENGSLIRKTRANAEKERRNWIENLPGNEYLIAEPNRSTFHGCSCLIHKSVFNKVGMFDESLRLLNDLDMWYRIYIGGFRLEYLPEPLVQGRIHEKQISRSVGYSIHNPEQDWFWDRSFKWLIQNHADNDWLFFLFGRNAYLKTRNEDGRKAFAVVAKLRPERKTELKIKACAYQFRASIRTLGKKVYLALRA